MRLVEFNITEIPDDGNRGGQEPNKPVTDEPNGGLQAGPPYPPEQMDAVKDFQKALQSAGYSVGSTGVDGKYGPRTARAVAGFKKDYGVKGDGQEVDDFTLTTIMGVSSGKIPKVKNTYTASVAGSQRSELGQLSQDSVTQGKVGQVLDLIAGPESGGRYDAVYPSRRRPQILDMTIDELVQDMIARGRASGSSASGRYQYIRKTLTGVARQMGLDTSKEKFTPKLQDEIAIFHLRANHGLDRWLSGSMSNEQFLNRLAGTWAGIPKTNGRSAHAGILNNKAGIGAQTALQGLDAIRATA
jgi:peptidoglycan hydrolase-like protein with peptidoglycan-binding domain